MSLRFLLFSFPGITRGRREVGLIDDDPKARIVEERPRYGQESRTGNREQEHGRDLTVHSPPPLIIYLLTMLGIAPLKALAAHSGYNIDVNVVMRRNPPCLSNILMIRASITPGQPVHGPILSAEIDSRRGHKAIRFPSSLQFQSQFDLSITFRKYSRCHPLLYAVF